MTVLILFTRKSENTIDRGTENFGYSISSHFISEFTFKNDSDVGEDVTFKTSPLMLLNADVQKGMKWLLERKKLFRWLLDDRSKFLAEHCIACTISMLLFPWMFPNPILPSLQNVLQTCFELGIDHLKRTLNSPTNFSSSWVRMLHSTEVGSMHVPKYAFPATFYLFFFLCLHVDISDLIHTSQFVQLSPYNRRLRPFIALNWSLNEYRMG